MTDDVGKFLMQRVSRWLLYSLEVRSAVDVSTPLIVMLRYIVLGEGELLHRSRDEQHI